MYDRFKQYDNARNLGPISIKIYQLVNKMPDIVTAINGLNKNTLAYAEVFYFWNNYSHSSFIILSPEMYPVRLYSISAMINLVGLERIGLGFLINIFSDYA